MSVVLAGFDDLAVEKKTDIESDPSGVHEVPACTVHVKRESICTFSLYVFALGLAGFLFAQFSDQDFSAVLTVGAAIHCFAFTILLNKVQLHQSVAGLSARSLELYALFYLFRLTSTVQKNGYIPVDRSGDWLYQVFDASALLMILQLLYCIYVSHRSSYQSHLDLGLDFLRVIPALMLLGFFVHGELNHQIMFDVIWQISLNFQTAALLPQLYMMYKLPKIEALNSHYVAAITAGNFCSFLFWFWGFPELAPGKQQDVFNLPGYVVVGCHTIMLLSSAEFMIKYLRVVFTSGQEAIKVLDEK